jgi:hypothetical protein
MLHWAGASYAQLPPLPTTSSSVVRTGGGLSVAPASASAWMIHASCLVIGRAACYHQRTGERTFRRGRSRLRPARRPLARYGPHLLIAPVVNHALITLCRLVDARSIDGTATLHHRCRNRWRRHRCHLCRLCATGSCGAAVASFTSSTQAYPRPSSHDVAAVMLSRQLGSALLRRDRQQLTLQPRGWP